MAAQQPTTPKLNSSTPLLINSTTTTTTTTTTPSSSLSLANNHHQQQSVVRSSFTTTLVPPLPIGSHHDGSNPKDFYDHHDSFSDLSEEDPNHHQGSLKNQRTSRAQNLFNVVKSSIGWLAFSIVFNVLNTIVYSALYPKILHNVSVNGGSDYSTAFSITNTVTTLASALSLPILGSLVDNMKIIRASMMVTMYLGIIATIGLFFTDKLPNATSEDMTTHLAICEVVYILAMFFLRFSVMNNNALLPSFDKKNMMILSLSGNFIGFGVNLLGLLILAFTPKTVFSGDIWEITRENWWVLVFTCFTILVSFFVFLSPNGVDRVTLNPDTELNSSSIIMKKELEVPQIFNRLPKALRGLGKIVTVVKNSFIALSETFENWRTNTQYYHCWIFLLSYLFFSTAGTVVTIYLGPLFIDIYHFSLEQEVLLNLYFKVAMVGGVIGGVIFERLFKFNDIYVLAAQNSLFGALTLSIFITISLKVNRYAVLAQFLLVGFLYAWNASVARGLMSKLIPVNKKCEFMGFFSTFTYLGISITSGVYALLSKFQLPSHTLLLILFIWLIPAFLFLAILKQSLDKHADKK
ncbi:hypothetical protein C9374_007654 [Naegleria lovaniensis]|uniref:Uncharacterized protein n=1 Tax=Naegleria lovaniensis TaxID=51637 RepID=A0AA88KI95_NAELO|nr:uncharacterized protein C9374_007654 [Naegleria lovaniensis]KAG2379016.1 hypothetical protein C9374_007654 [Naegleria lovaniensis]